MVLIPSAFFEVLFEPITDYLKRLGSSIATFFKWVGISILYLLFLVLIMFINISLFVIGSEICKHFGV